MPTDTLLLLSLIYVVHCLSVTITNQPELLIGSGTLIFTQGFVFSNLYNIFC